MTALETLLANSINFAALGTELYTTTTSLDSVDDDFKTVTMTLSVSTALNNIQVSDDLVFLQNAQSYVESMSEQQLVDLDQLLSEKELDLSLLAETKENAETSKVYVKQDAKQQK